MYSFRKAFLFLAFILFIAIQAKAQCWTRVADLPAADRRNTTGFAIGDSGYVCLGGVGTSASSTHFKDLWLYTPNSNSWTRKTDFPGNERRNSFAFVIGKEAFVGNGYDNTQLFSDVYKYNQPSDSWIAISNYPGNGRRNNFATSANGKGYVGGGAISTGSSSSNQFYEYDPTTNTWTQLANFPFGNRSGGVAVSIGGLLYLGLGLSNGGVYHKDLWSFDPTTSIWTQLTDFPGQERFELVSFLFDGKILVGGGTGSGGNAYGDYYLYDPMTDVWQSTSTFSFGTRSRGASFESSTAGFASTGFRAGSNQSDTWRYALNYEFGTDTIFACIGNTYTLDATTTGASSYLWNDNTTNPIKQVNSDGKYWVEVTVNGCTSTDSVYVKFTTPRLDLGADTTLCAGNTLTLDAQNPGATYLWQNNSTASTYTVTQAGQYYVEVDLNGCIERDTLNVNYNPNPTVDLGNDTTICQGSSLSLDATNAGATYLWQDNSTSSNYTVSQAGLYWVEVDLNGCIERDSILVTYQNIPQVNLGSDTTLCDGNTLTLDATNLGATYLWQDNSNTSAITVTQAGQYFVEVNLNGCIERDTINVNYNPSPTVDLGNDTTLCQGSSLSLDATNAGATYLWQDNSTAATFNVNQAGLYWAEVDLNGCVERDSILVTYQNLPQVNLGADTTLCAGNTLTLNAQNPGSAYTWQDNSSASTFTVTQAGQYYVEVGLNGCLGSDTINVNFDPSPTVDLGNDTTLCQGSSLSLDATNAGATYLWQDNSTAATFNVNQAGLYWVEVVLNGCVERDSILVTYQNLPQVNLGADTTLCAGNTLTLDAQNPGAAYTWQDNSAASTFTVTQAGQYYVEVDLNGCKGSDTINVNYIPSPTVNLGNDTTLCHGSSLTLDATNAGATYLWQDNSTAATFNVNQAGLYWAEVDLNGCVERDSIRIEFDTLPQIEMVSDSLFCEGEGILLEPLSSSPGPYLWQDGSLEKTYFATQAGEFYAIISNVCGSDTASINLFAEDCQCLFVWPNVITPNGDRINDDFLPLSACPYESFRLLIFNRWGEKVFESESAGIGWDGRSQGYQSHEGVYIYRFEYRNVGTESKVEVGHFTLIR